MPEYRYIGPAAHFLDRHAGTGKVWKSDKGVAFPNGGTLDERRAWGSIQDIPLATVALFEKQLVNNTMPQFERVVEEDVAAAAVAPAGKKKAKAPVDPGPDFVPVGTAYSAFSAEQIKDIYLSKTGKRPEEGSTVAALVAELQLVDAAAAAQTDVDVF